ncbi:MAG: hypothetical protein IIV45_14205 [Lachnospiraceae bacterium]|jgi:hypothetical protein|nr:hypothetical protein [Peptococcaceae bacterium]MBQ2432239.1 hypothetical protein [Peptococcaceae bacterium]MBQ5369790.1 hypothetical protein [Peptococcaceae bacterium]MBQ5676195.1 hypothetical protein [Lachnospiraceae bacterium]MBQ5862147.1 hypothetical protein [Peptococcaceae bacterium]
MTIKWYWPAEMLGLVKNISHEYNDGGTYWSVAGNTGDVFLTLMLSMFGVMFFAGFLLHFIYRVKQNALRGEKIVFSAMIVLLVYAILLAVGVGPYIQFYPQSAGFLDFSTIEHIIDGIYVGLLALMLYLGSKADTWMSKKQVGEQ